MASRRRKSPQQQARRETKRPQPPGVGGPSSASSSSSPTAVLVPLAAKIQSVLWQVEYALRATLASIVISLIGLYRESWTKWEEMAFGLSRWFKGEGEGDDVEMDERKKLLSDRSTPDGKKVKRRRAQASLPASGAGEHFPGMINLSGTLCYMNSVLQAFASLPSLVKNLDTIISLAVAVDLPTPVTDALAATLAELNTPHARAPRPIRPVELLQALRELPQIQRLLGTREQQDAHELFVVLAEGVSDEAMKVAVEFARTRGLGEVLSLQAGIGASKTGKGRSEGINKEKRVRLKALQQHWEGLMARRRVCRRCGWCEAVRMEALGGMELPVPLHGEITLDASIAAYLAPENLSDVTCEMCSLRSTHQYYAAEYARLAAPPSSQAMNGHASSSSTSSSGSFAALQNLPSNGAEPDAQSSGMTSSRKKRAKEAKRVELRLQEMLQSGTVTGFQEATLSPTASNPSPVTLKWQNTRSDSIRQAAIVRPPQSLRLHFVRSEYTPYGQLLKKTARVAFPVILDLTRFVARGVWEERTSVLGMLDSGQNEAAPKRVLYRLESAILHYGYAHSSGHFVALRRKPQRLQNPDTTPDGEAEGDVRKPQGVKKSCPDWCTCEQCQYFGPVRETKQPGKGWLRISDADVEEVGEEALIESRGAVFMLFYEKVGDYPGSAQSRNTPQVDHSVMSTDGRGSSIATSEIGE